jgi:hypothetical protein
VSTPNILARKSEKGQKGLLPYCKPGAVLEGNNQLGPLVNVIKSSWVTNCVNSEVQRFRDPLVSPSSGNGVMGDHSVLFIYM